MMEYKVIFHIDKLSQWSKVLRNVYNLIKAAEEESISIEVLANSEAVKYYCCKEALESDIKSMEALNKKGVSFVACSNALRSYGIAKENIISFVQIVPAGVFELVKRQREGYAYIKA